MMKSILLAIACMLLSLHVEAQTVGETQYPASIDNGTTLPVAVDNKFTALTVTVNASDTTFTVSSTSGWPSAGTGWVNQEQFTYTGTTGNSFTGITRGFGSTIAAVHGAHAVVRLIVGAAHVNGTRGAALALEAKVGPGASNASGASTGQCLVKQADGSTAWSTCGSGTSGTVTSVGLSLLAELTVTNSPVTGAGTLTGAWATQAANLLFRSGDAGGIPSFSALTASDIPSLDATKIGSGTVPAARMPALTGDVTTSAGGVVTTIANGAVTEAKITLADNTTNNVSTTKHGLAPKLPNDATKYLDGTGAYSVPSGGVTSIAGTANQVTASAATGAVTLSLPSTITKGNSSLLLDASGTTGFPSTDFIYPNSGRMRFGEVSVAGPNDVFMQAFPGSTSGSGFLETWNGAGMVVGTGNTSPVSIRPNRTEVGRFTTLGLVMGNGNVAVQKFTAGQDSLDFTALAANSCEVLAVTVTGAAAGDAVQLSVPDALADVDGGTERTVFFGWVSATNTVSVRRCNVTGTATADPAAATVRALVTKF
jgi:hypothetical protein